MTKGYRLNWAAIAVFVTFTGALTFQAATAPEYLPSPRAMDAAYMAFMDKFLDMNPQIPRDRVTPDHRRSVKAALRDALVAAHHEEFTR